MNDWTTLHIQACLDRLHAGETAAREELFASCMERLGRQVRRMLHTRFPDVRRWEGTADVLQEVGLRLDRALRNVPVRSAEHFLRLASDHIRYALIDFARRVRNPNGTPANHASGGSAGPPDPPDPETTASLRWWEEFHEAVERMADPQREVFCLTYYQEFTHEQVGQLVGVSPATVKRRLEEARVWLFRQLGLPDDSGGNS